MRRKHPILSVDFSCIKQNFKKPIPHQGKGKQAGKKGVCEAATSLANQQWIQACARQKINRWTKKENTLGMEKDDEKRALNKLIGETFSD